MKSLKTVFAICCPTTRLVLEGFSERSTSQSPMITAAIGYSRGRPIASWIRFCHHRKHNLNMMTAYFLRVPDLLKTGLNCLHNFNNEKRNYIKPGVEKDVLHLVEGLDRVMAKLKATYQIGTKSTTCEARKRKERRKKKGKEEARNLWKQKKKRMPYFPFSGRSPLEDFAPDIFGISHLETVDCETLHLFISKTDKACLHNLCSCKLFCQGSPGDCLVLLHLRVNELKTVL